MCLVAINLKASGESAAALPPALAAMALPGPLAVHMLDSLPQKKGCDLMHEKLQLTRRNDAKRDQLGMHKALQNNVNSSWAKLGCILVGPS